MHRVPDHGGKILSIASGLGVHPDAILDFSASINPLGPSPSVGRSINDALSLVGNYPEIGSPELCRKLADYHSVHEDTVAVANGSTELIHLLPRLFRRAMGRGLIISPSFSEYANSLQLAGWEVNYLTLNHSDGFELDTTAVERELVNGYDICFFCNPGNPSGRLYSIEEVMSLYWTCKSSGCFFVLDEAFIDFSEDFSAKRLIPASDSGMILRSLTKFFGFPGIRIGYSIASPAVTARIRRFLPPWNVGVIAQAAALAALNDHKHIRHTVEFIENEKQYLLTALSCISGIDVYTGSANYLLLRINGESTAGDLQERLLKRLILIRDCSDFEGLDNSFFRIAVKGRAENSKLLQAIAEALNLNV